MTDWITMWIEYKSMIIKAMEQNIAADAKAGYSEKTLEEQEDKLVAYRVQYKKELAMIATMENQEAHEWCHNQLKKAGAI